MHYSNNAHIQDSCYELNHTERCMQVTAEPNKPIHPLVIVIYCSELVFVRTHFYNKYNTELAKQMFCFPLHGTLKREATEANEKKKFLERDE